MLHGPSYSKLDKLGQLKEIATGGMSKKGCKEIKKGHASNGKLPVETIANTDEGPRHVEKREYK